MEDNRSSTTIAYDILKDSKLKHLSKYKWGIGLEHEMQLFHKPSSQNKKIIENFIILNSKYFLEEVIKKNMIPLEYKNFIQSIPFEPTGRKCNGKTVLKKLPIPMPEFISENPFSSLPSGKRGIESYITDMRNKEEIFIKLLYKNKKLKKLIEKYGDIYQYPFGMSSYIKLPELDNNSYKLKKENEIDYVGSYHITLTLPFSEKTTLSRFIKRHQNFANQIQWIEPLLIAGFFSSDDKAMGTNEKRIKGSFRVARVGWGNFAGTDIRKFSKGIGRYTNIKSFWRKDFEFYQSDKANYCADISQKLKKIEPGAISGYSSNFRTFGSTDILRPWHRESGKGMTLPNGIEIRIFDHFDSSFFIQLSRLIIYLAENSRNHLSTQYVYNSEPWILSLRNIILNGWYAQIHPEYINLLRQQLNLKINTTSLIAYDILKQINKELFKKNKDGDWALLLLDIYYKKEPELPHINRKSWEFGFMLFLNNNPKFLLKFHDLINSFNKYKKLEIEEFEIIFLNSFGNNWKNDIFQIIFFIESIEVFKLNFDKYGMINKINVDHKKIDNYNEYFKIHKDFNIQLLKNFNPKLFEIIRERKKETDIL